jgi:hypothetical protein
VGCLPSRFPDFGKKLTWFLVAHGKETQIPRARPVVKVEPYSDAAQGTTACAGSRPTVRRQDLLEWRLIEATAWSPRL